MDLPASEPRPGTQLSDYDQQALNRIKTKGLKISTSKLNLLDVKMPHSPAPTSPLLKTPTNFSKATNSQDDNPTQGQLNPNNPCFPTRSSMTKEQIDKMNDALRAKSAKRVRINNPKLKHESEWAELLREIDLVIERQLEPLAVKAKAVTQAYEEKKVSQSDAADKFKAQIVRAFDDISNSNYIIQREHHKISYIGTKPKKVDLPADDETVDEDEVDHKEQKQSATDSCMMETMGLLRFLIAQLPQKWDAFREHLRKLDAEEVDYDEKLDKRRLHKISAFVEDAGRALDELRMKLPFASGSE